MCNVSNALINKLSSMIVGNLTDKALIKISN